jgi:hypothetical protein
VAEADSPKVCAFGRLLNQVSRGMRNSFTVALVLRAVFCITSEVMGALKV